MLGYFVDGSMPSNYLISDNLDAYLEMRTILADYGFISDDERSVINDTNDLITGSDDNCSFD